MASVTELHITAQGIESIVLDHAGLDFILRRDDNGGIQYCMNIRGFYAMVQFWISITHTTNASYVTTTNK